MASNLIQAIDVHGHYGEFFRDENTPLKDGFMSGDAATVVKRARMANTQATIVSPSKGLFPRFRADAFSGNEEAARDVEIHRELLQWVIIDPGDPRTYQQAAEMLGSQRCVGIKIHPESIDKYNQKKEISLFSGIIIIILVFFLLLLIFKG